MFWEIMWVAEGREPGLGRLRGHGEEETSPRACGFREAAERWGPVASGTAATIERESVVSSVNGQ